MEWNGTPFKIAENKWGFTTVVVGGNLQVVIHPLWISTWILSQLPLLFTLQYTNIAGWNILIFNRKYIFNPGPLSIFHCYVRLPECILWYFDKIHARKWWKLFEIPKVVGKTHDWWSKLIGMILVTLPKTNIAPTNGWLEYYFPIGEAYFQGLR